MTHQWYSRPIPVENHASRSPIASRPAPHATMAGDSGPEFCSTWLIVG